jgi:hypothetical protein
VDSDSEDVMSINFPSSPTVGQIVTIGGATYIWNGRAWDAKVPNAVVPTQDTPPASPVDGLLWWESDSGATFIWYDDGNTAQWVQINGGGGGGGGGSALVPTQDAPPDAPQDGQLWWESDSGDMFIWYDDGTSSQWIQVNSSSTALITTDDVPPVNPVDGMLWWRSTNGKLYVYYDDGSSQQWVDTSASTSTPVGTAEAKNRVWNPTMRTSQENGGAAVGNAQYAADGWYFAYISTSTVLAQKGAAHVSMIPSTADTSIAAGEYSLLIHPIEGNDLYDLNLGSANSEAFVIALDAFMSVAGVYTVSITNGDSTKYTWLGTFNISVGEINTFVRKTVAVPKGAINAGVWPTDNSIGIYLRVCFACGTTNQGVAGLQTGSKFAVAAQANALAVTNGCAIRNVGLYKDPLQTGNAPAFEYPELGAEFLKCLRYYQKSANIYSLEQYVPVTGTGMFAPISYQTPMRGVPTITFTNASFTACGTLTANAAAEAMRVNAVSTSGGSMAYATFGFTANARLL